MRLSRLLLLGLLSLLACSGGVTNPGGGAEPTETRIVYSLLSGNAAGPIAGLLVSRAGAAVFHVEQLIPAGARISQVELIEPDGTSFSLFSPGLAKDLDTGALHTTLIETAIDEINAFIRENLDLVPPGAAALAHELKTALEEERINPESLEDHIHRFFTEAAISCLQNPVECVNAFLEAIGETDLEIEDDDPASGDVSYGSGDIEVVDSDGSATPIDAYATFAITPLVRRAPVDLTATLLPGTPLNFDGSGLQHAWSYSSEESSPTIMGSGTTASVLLTVPGSYDITLVVSSARYGGSVATATQTVEVLPPLDDPPSFIATRQNTGLPQTWTLIASDPSGNAISFAWSSDGGEVAQGQNTSMVFASAGTYEITLTVGYQDATFAQAAKSITVTDDGSGGGDVDARIQEAFDNMAGTYISTRVLVSNDETGLWGSEKDVTFDGVNTRTTYTVVVDPTNLTVSIEPSGKLLQFPPLVSDYSYVTPTVLQLGDIFSGQLSLSKSFDWETVQYLQIAFSHTFDNISHSWRIRRES